MDIYISKFSLLASFLTILLIAHMGYNFTLEETSLLGFSILCFLSLGITISVCGLFDLKLTPLSDFKSKNFDLALNVIYSITILIIFLSLLNIIICFSPPINI